MVSELFNNYCNYKIKTIYQYSIILSKIINVDGNKLFGSQKKSETFWNYVISDYFKRYLLNNKANKVIIKSFISAKEVNKYNITNEMMSVINYFINNNIVFDLDNNEHEVVLAAAILKIANSIDMITSPYLKNKNNYNTIIINMLDSYHQIPYFNLIDDGKKETKNLIELVKTNVRKERKIFELLTNVKSFNRYIDISEENNYYLAQYNYSVANLNKYDEFAIRKIYDDEGIDDNFILISSNLIMGSLMKLISIRKDLKVFFLPIRKSFFDNSNNIKELNKILNDKLLKKYFKILLNYDECDTTLIGLMQKNHFEYYIYCSKGSGATDGNKLNGSYNYLLSKDFNLSYPKIVKNWLQDEKVNLLIENFDGIVTDKDLLTI